MGKYENEVKKDCRSSVLECVREKNDRWITNTPSGGGGTASLAFSEPHKFSNNALERLELLQY